MQKDSPADFYDRKMAAQPFAYSPWETKSLSLLDQTLGCRAIREHLYGVSTIFRDFDVISRRLVDRCVVLCYAGCEFRLEKNRKDNSVTAEKQKRSLPFLIVQLHS